MIKFNKNSNILDYTIDDVVKNIKQEQKSGKKCFLFDSNFSAVHFFNYFIENLEQTEEEKSINLISSYLSDLINESPKTFNEAVSKAYSLLELDKSIKEIFNQTTPQVICAFLYNNFSKLIFDEFYFFYDKCPTLSNICKELNINNVEQILYEIVLATSYHIKRELKQNGEQFEMELPPLTVEDLNNLKDCPKDLRESIDSLLNAVESKYSKIKNLTITEQTVDVLTCGLFSETYHILFYGWYLYYDKSPLRKWFERERKMTDPYYITYYIIRNFVNFLMLKKSTE